jgi:hypothetical protein
MLKQSASFVLASLRGSTYRSVRLASSLAAASLDGHFEHLAKYWKQPTPLPPKKTGGAEPPLLMNASAAIADSPLPRSSSLVVRPLGGVILKRDTKYASRDTVIIGINLTRIAVLCSFDTNRHE